MRLVQLELPSRPEFVSLARLVVSSVAGDRYELSDEQLDDLKLAVSEACVMAIGCEHPPDAGVSIVCDGMTDRLNVSVEAGAGCFPAAQVVYPEGMTGTGSERLGYPLIETLVDDLSVEDATDRSRLSMVVHCLPAERL